MTVTAEVNGIAPSGPDSWRVPPVWAAAGLPMRTVGVASPTIVGPV